jgi:hypothetical protein
MENKVIAKEYVRNIIIEKIKWLEKQTIEGKYYFENVKLANDILDELLEKIK